jgi:hypothetical protein
MLIQRRIKRRATAGFYIGSIRVLELKNIQLFFFFSSFFYKKGLLCQRPCFVPLFNFVCSIRLRHVHRFVLLGDIKREMATELPWKYSDLEKKK